MLTLLFFVIKCREYDQVLLINDVLVEFMAELLYWFALHCTDVSKEAAREYISLGGF